MSTPALTVAYVVKGFLSQANSSSPGWIAEVEADGEDTMFQHLCDFADLVEAAWSDDLPDKGWGGMWDYEISEPLGEWVGAYMNTNDSLPDYSDVRKRIAELVKGAMPK